MSLQSRARHVASVFGFSYQQALQRIRDLGSKPAEIAKQYKWALKEADVFLIREKPSPESPAQEAAGFKAIGDYIERSIVAVVFGPDGKAATNVGSGILLRTSKHFVVLTAWHVAKRARTEPLRLVGRATGSALPDFVGGILRHPRSSEVHDVRAVDVGLLVVKSDYESMFADLKLPSAREVVAANDDVEVKENDNLFMTGSPWAARVAPKDSREHGFVGFAYHTGIRDDCGETEHGPGLHVEWRWAEPGYAPSEVIFELPDPYGISGGPVWRYTRQPPPPALWTPTRGRVVGINVDYWPARWCARAQSVADWGEWFREAVEAIDRG
jgi:hypothetical protein